MDVLSALVLMDNDSNPHVHGNTDVPKRARRYVVHGIMPNLLVKFAEGSCINSGLHLLK